MAIDLEEEIPYEAGRIPSPDRIFFDLHGTKLAPELMGKSFDVEDGFLKRIRVAQYQPGMTRVVLEVAPVSEYSAFLLPNPYRLIVDIHGQQPASVSARERQPSPAEMPQPKTSAENSSSAAVGSRSAAVIRNEVPTDAVRKNAAISSTTPSPVKPPGKTSAARSEAEEPKKAPAESKTAEVKATERPTTSPTFQAVTPREEHKPSRGKEKEREIEAIAREAKPSADGQRGLIRALGLKIGKIVVDAGHGGHDTGTIGPRGLMEKDLVLDVSLRLGKLLENKLGADVVYTRNDDTFIP
ncbi:MAG TPA: N-acetylmuramoyl-L-alanine amidase, partial [Terriglobales bacterium]|nr:N-acetylmuramoyl-L-alanine amidase [Terriglobales bacterium]